MGNESSVYTGEEEEEDAGNGDRTDVRSVRMAPHVTAIPPRAFARYVGLREVDLGHATVIGEGAFRMCPKLRRINLARVTAIGDNAFGECIELEEVDVPSLSTIGERAFETCPSLREIAVPSTVRTIGSGAFSYCGGLSKVTLGEGVERIEGEAFLSCTSLMTIAIPSTVRGIGHAAFYNCSRLDNIQLGGGLEDIGPRAFNHCTSLEHLHLPSSVTEIGHNAFGRCSSLVDIELSEGVQRIGDDAFRDCPLLEHIRIPSPSFVVLTGVDGNPECRLVRNARSPLDVRMVASKCVKHMSPNQLVEVEGKVNAILRRRDHLTQPIYGKIRKLFAYYELVELTSLLELSIWKANIVEEGIGQDGELRQACRRSCGQDVNVIVPAVLQFLDRKESGDCTSAIT